MALVFDFPLLLAADWVDVIKALAPLFFILYWVVTNWFGRKGQPQQQRRPARPVPAKPVAPPATSQAALREPVEEFRRRQSELRPGQRPAPPAAPVRPAEELPRKRRRPLADRPTVPPAASDAAASEPRKIGQLAEALALKAEERLATADSRLTSIERGDVERERHRHQTFDHQLGRLKDGDAATEAERKQTGVDRPTSPAAAIAAMLRSPGSIQQAIVLGEILNRPEGRWR